MESLERTTANATLYPLGEEYGSYAEAINEGWKKVSEPYLFTGADDLIFSPGWLQAALTKMKGAIKVVGTNDLHNPYVLQGLHSTHSLVARDYIEDTGAVIDAGPGSFLYPYDHNYVDAELVETARHRSVFAPCLEAVVEHRHPDFNGRAPDAIDKKTRKNLKADHAIFASRRHLWEPREDESIFYNAP